MLPGQLDLPGIAAEPLRDTLARKAAELLKPSAEQEPPGPLFGGSAGQVDLVELAAKP